MPNTKGEIVDKKAISSAVDVMRMAAHYLEVLKENDGLLKAKNHLIGKNRNLRVQIAELTKELETVSVDRFRLQVEKDARTVADDPDFEVADAPADEKGMGPLGRSVEELKRFVSDG